MGAAVYATLAVSATTTLVLALLGSVDRITIAAFGFSVPSTVELSSALLASLVLGSIAATQRRQANIEISLVLDLLPQSVSRVLRRVMLVLSAIVVAYLAWRLSVLAQRSVSNLEFATGLWGFPVYPFKIWCAGVAWLASVEFAWQAIFFDRVHANPDRKTKSLGED